MTRCVVRPATLRDITYVASNMRDADRAEIECQYPAWSPTWLGALCMGAEWKWVAAVNGEPVAALGFSHLNTVTVMGWSWGTKRYRRAVPEMFRFITAAERQLRDGGIRRIEVRVLDTHTEAVRMIDRMGGRAIAKLPQHGVNGEGFTLFEKVLAPPSQTQDTD